VQLPGKGQQSRLVRYAHSARSIRGMNIHFRLRENRVVPHYCTLIPGDGIGPEVAQATVRAVEATGVDLVWRRAELNEAII